MPAWNRQIARPSVLHNNNKDDIDDVKKQKAKERRKETVRPAYCSIR
jgi:hypothetical protein